MHHLAKEVLVAQKGFSTPCGPRSFGETPPETLAREAKLYPPSPTGEVKLPEGAGALGWGE